MFRNWNAVCEIGRQSPALMMALLSLPAGSDLGERLKATFPECWGDHSEEGPIPLSLLIRKEKEEGNCYFGPEPDIHADLVQHGLSSVDNGDYGLPVIEYTSDLPKYPYLTTEEGVELPRDVHEQCKRFKNIVKIGGADFVVLYYSKNSFQEWVCLVPAERIALDL